MTRLAPAVLLLAASALPAAPVPKAKKADPFPYTVGTKWEYIRGGDESRVYVEEVTENAEKDGVRTVRIDITTDTNGKQFEKYELKDGELRLTASTSGEYGQGMLIRKAGMKEGDTWENKYTLNGTEYVVECTVGKPEELATPAGKFTAFPISRKYVQPNSRTQTTYWYGDGVGLVRQTLNGRQNQELKAFTPGK
jgi:DnaJ-class molecular chaperone